MYASVSKLVALVAEACRRYYTIRSDEYVVVTAGGCPRLPLRRVSGDVYALVDDCGAALQVSDRVYIVARVECLAE